MYMSSMDCVLEASAVFHTGKQACQVWPVLLTVDFTLHRPLGPVPADSINCSGVMLDFCCWSIWGASNACCFVLSIAESSFPLNEHLLHASCRFGCGHGCHAPQF